MASTVDVINGALILLGQEEITAVDENDKASRCNTRLSSFLIDATLRAYKWNCAQVRSPALTAEVTPPAFGYGYAYALPTNPYCLRVIQMQEKEYKFKIEKRYLMTDESPAQILYVARIAITAMDSLLVDTLTARLAADMAFTITNSTSLAEAMVKLYLLKLQEAQEVDAFEGTEDDMTADDWVNSRL